MPRSGARALARFSVRSAAGCRLIPVQPPADFLQDRSETRMKVLDVLGGVRPRPRNAVKLTRTRTTTRRSEIPAINIKFFQALTSDFRATLAVVKPLNFDLVVPQNADKVSMDAFSGVTIASHGGNDAKLKFRVRVALKRQNSINAMKTKFTILLTTVVAVTVCFVAPSTAQQLIYQEGFNTDGEAANPQRYTTIGRDVYKIGRLKTEVDTNTMQLGPVYWAHNFNVPNSFVGVPGPTPARRAMLAWDSTITADAVSPQMQSVLMATFNWLLNNKASAKVVVLPNMAAAQYFADVLAAAGHTVTDICSPAAVTHIGLSRYS